MTIYLVRHGETEFNRDGRGLGRMDLELTEVGKAQAAAAATALADVGFAAIYSSPLQRASYLAELVAGESGLTVEVREELTEMDVGVTEGLLFAETRERYPAFFDEWRSSRAHESVMPGGESIGDVADRVRGFAAEVREHAASGDVCVVSHNFVQRALICELLGMGIENFRSFGIELASITTLAIRRGTVRIERLNDVCHLRLLEPSGKQP